MACPFYHVKADTYILIKSDSQFVFFFPVFIIVSVKVIPPSQGWRKQLPNIIIRALK